jgi:protocatechuate 3,4-dioxygenase beta subunit
MEQKDRRQFLKNSSMAALGLGLLGSTKAAPSPSEAFPTNAPDCNPTTVDYYGQGPFYTANAPVLSDNILAPSTETGIRLIISGRVLNLSCDEYLPDTTIDIWHANHNGAYDNSGFNLRGKVISNSQGFYIFETIVPGKYLNGSAYRPSHIHFKISPPGFSTLTTQLYFEGDTDIPADAAASITSGQYDASHRIISLTTNANEELEGTWDIVLNGDGVTLGLNDLHLDKGVIYSISPNPFSDRVEIRYGIFKSARVGLLVYDIEGRLVATLEDRELGPEKYTAVWQPSSYMSDGHYFIALKVNDIQVNYMKVILGKY